MKKILLIGAAFVADADGKSTMRYPSEGQIETAPAEADRLIAAGLAKDDDLEAKKVAELLVVAAGEGVPLGDATKKADIVEAIRSNRDQ